MARPNPIRLGPLEDQELADADTILDEHGYPVDVAHVTKRSSLATCVSTAADTAKSLKPESMKSKEPNKCLKASQERQQPNVKDITKSRTPPSGKTDVPRTNFRQPTKTKSDYSVADAHAPRNGAVQQTENRSSFDGLPPGLLPITKHNAVEIKQDFKHRGQEENKLRIEPL